MNNPAMNNEAAPTITAGQLTEISLTFSGKAGGKPGTFAVVGADLYSEGALNGGLNKDGWAVKADCPADDVPTQVTVFVPASALGQVTVYLNAPDRAAYWQAPLTMPVSAVAPAKQPVATTGPVVAAPAPEGPALQPLTITLPFDAPCVLSRVAAHI